MSAAVVLRRLIRGTRIGALLLVTALASASVAQDLLGGMGDESSPFDVTADSVEFETDRSVYVARGNVVIRQPRRTLTADWVAFSNVTRQGVATGNVVVNESGDLLYADVLHFEIDDLKGVVFDGRLDAENSEFRMAGDKIDKTGEQVYVFDNGTFTTCRCPADEIEPWVIRAEEAELEIGGYATTRNTTLEVLGIPMLWLPWMRYPLKTDRETGFLFPEFGFTERSGRGWGLPFFWAAADPVNVLITPRYVSDRGFKGDLEVEYVFGERSRGVFFGSYVFNDESVDPDDVSTPYDSERWGIEWLHDQDLPGGFRWKVDARFMSDNNYAFDFNEFSNFRRDRYMEALTFVEKRFGLLGRYGFTAELRAADDIQNPDDQDRDTFLIHRAPDLRLAALPQPLGIVSPRTYGSFDLRYTHFWSPNRASSELPLAIAVDDDIFLDTGIDSIPDGEERDSRGRIVRTDGSIEMRDGTVLTAAEFNSMFPDVMPPPDVDGSQDDFPPGIEGDGAFQEGEPLGDRGHRILVNPRISHPFRIGDLVEVLPELGWHATAYQTDEQSSVFRNLFTAQLDVRARLRRQLEIPFGIGPAVHLMEPRFSYTAMTSDSQKHNPLFIPRPAVLQKRIRQLEPSAVLRDPSDRIESVNAVTFALGNRFYLPSREEGAPPQLFADVTLSFQEDFENAALRNFYMDGTLFPYERVRARFNFGYDFDQGEVSEVLLQGGWFSEAGHDLAIGYRLVEDIPRFFEAFRFDEERFEDFEEGFLRVNQFDLFARWAITRQWALTYRARYSFEQSLALTNQGGVEYTSRCLCWAIRAELANNRSRGLEFNLQYRIIGLGDDTVRPFNSRRRRRSNDSIIEQPSPSSF